VLSREADDIANLAFIGGKTNRVISDKPPKEYLAFFAAKSGEEGFSVQEIPLDPELLDTPAYKKFLEVRRNESQPGSTCSSPAEGHNTLNNEDSFIKIQSLLCRNPKFMARNKVGKSHKGLRCLSRDAAEGRSQEPKAKRLT
jgi:hypothetical protein